MALTEEQIEHYYREGYTVARALAPEETLAAVMEAAIPRARAGNRWQATVFDHGNPEADWPIHRLLWEPSIVEAAGQLLGTPPRVFYGMLAIVPPGGGHGLPWHQDNQYTHLLGGALNVFIALRDISTEMANLWVSPRSHLHGVQPSKENTTTAPGYREAEVEPENAVAMPDLRAGDAVIFDRYTYHRSLQNTSDQPRFAYAAQYQAQHARRAMDGKRDPSRMLAVELGDRIKRLGD